ncbi:MAG: hypothetical protein KF819_21845 [Labilithrix sp.]|nr:hypothetical protein [Labilithrix sp.]
MGNDSSKLFQPAISDMLRQLDAQLNSMPPPKPQQDDAIPHPRASLFELR